MKRFLSWLLGIIACFGLVFILIFASFHLCLNDDKWFQTEVYRLDAARKSGHKVTELMSALEIAQARLSGDKDASGEFTSRELRALDAVAEPIGVLRLAFFISLGVCFIFLITVPFAMKRKSLLIISRSYVISASICLLPVVFLTAAVGTSFDWAAAWGKYIFSLPKLSSDSLLGALFSDNLLYDLTMRAFKIGLILMLVLMAAAITYLVIRSRRLKRKTVE